jgi:hypothetical protein
VGYLPAFGLFRLPRGVPRRLLSEAYTDSQYRYFPSEETAKKFAVDLPSNKKVISIRPSNLEDVFIEYTGQKVDGGVIDEKARHGEDDGLD